MNRSNVSLHQPSPSSGRGWLEAVGCVTCIGALSLLYAVGHTLGAHPIAFILYAVLVSAVMTLLALGPGPNAREIIFHPLSWVVGLGIILLEVFYFQTLTYVTPVQGSVILRIATPFAMIAGCLFFRRRPTPSMVIGSIAILGAIAFVIAWTTPDVRWLMTVSGTIAAGFLTMRGFAAEFHPWNRNAQTVAEKLRVTGLIILVTSISSLVLASIAAVSVAAGVLPSTGLIPTVSQMLHAPTFLLGGLAGGAIFTFMMYLNFSSVVKITTENLTAMMAFAPLTAWFFQALADALGWIRAPRPALPIVVAIIVCIAAVLLIIGSSVRARGRRSG